MTDSTEETGLLPAVTILLACYGRLELLKLSVDSALKQRYPNYEVLIVDDGSDSAVVEWLRSLESREKKVRVLYRDHQGVAAARANGVAAANTEWICILDSDDLLVEDALAMLIDTMQKHKGVELLHANIREVHPNGDAAVRSYKQYTSARAMTMATLMKPRLPFKHSATLFRRQTALDLGSYDTDLPCKIDIDLYLKFLAAGYLPFHVDRALVDFRMHKDSVSIDRLAGIRVWMYLIDRYGPANPVYRMLIKTVRIGAELLKRVYMEIRG